MEYQFKPFDQVLVRTSDTALWFASIYSHYSHKERRHVCSGGGYFMQCLPYNEETVHLLGTDEPYKEPKPKDWQISSHGNNPQNLTSEEVLNFIKIAVLNNKDVTDVRIKYIR